MSKVMKVATVLVTSTLIAGALTIFSSDSVVHATHNLWRCSNCGAQTQTSSSHRPAPGTCAKSRSGHNWQFVP